MQGLCPRCMLLSNFRAEIGDADALSEVPGSVLDGKYRIERPLGRGGMGSVFLATHLGTGRQVAVKLISHEPARSPEFESRFRREARALGRLRHPNVVNITDFGVANTVNGDDTAYIVMEYLDGQTLAAYQKEHATVPVRMMLDVLDQVAAALNAAHQAGIIHRDLKPENIWLEPAARGGFSARVLDFGIAKMTVPAEDVRSGSVADDSSSTKTLDVIPAAGASSFHGATVRGSTVGTPAYMSPEQCRGERLDGRSDVYSLGVVAYSLLCGELPFSGTSMELIQKHVHATAPAIGAKRKGISRAVSDVVMSALEKDPELRPPSATAFVSRLRTAVELEHRIFPRSRILISSSAWVSFGMFFTHLLLAVPPGGMALYALWNWSVPPIWRDGLAVLSVLAIFMITANLAKAGWALVALQRLEHGAEEIRMRRVVLQFVRALPDLLFTQVVSLIRYPLPGRASLWPVVYIFEKRRGMEAVRRSITLTQHAQLPIRALFIREIGIAVLGATYGVVLTPILATGNSTDSGFRFFQSFCTFIMSAPWAMTTLAAYTILYFRCLHIMGEAPEPVMTEPGGPEFRNRIPALSGQSKLWLAVIVAAAIFSVYLYHGSDIFDAAGTGERLIKAGELGRITVVKELLAAGAKPDSTVGGWSPLTRAVLFGQERVVSALLAAGADVNKYERHIGSALYLAVAGRRDQLVRMLLDHGADPNAAPIWGQTPLMVAAMQGNTAVATLLLQRGADPARRSREGERASPFARREGHLELAELLERAEKR